MHTHIHTYIHTYTCTRTHTQALTHTHLWELGDPKSHDQFRQSVLPHYDQFILVVGPTVGEVPESTEDSDLYLGVRVTQLAHQDRDGPILPGGGGRGGRGEGRGAMDDSLKLTVARVHPALGQKYDKINLWQERSLILGER